MAVVASASKTAAIMINLTVFFESFLTLTAGFGYIISFMASICFWLNLCASTSSGKEATHFSADILQASSKLVICFLLKIFF